MLCRSLTPKTAKAPFGRWGFEACSRRLERERLFLEIGSSSEKRHTLCLRPLFPTYVRFSQCWEKPCIPKLVVHNPLGEQTHNTPSHQHPAMTKKDPTQEKWRNNPGTKKHIKKGENHRKPSEKSFLGRREVVRTKVCLVQIVGACWSGFISISGIPAGGCGMQSHRTRCQALVPIDESALIRIKRTKASTA